MVDTRGLATEGFTLGRSTGGVPRIIYYAPDGTVKGCVPGYLTDGKGVVYDRMVMDGWSLTPPDNPKPHCTGCDKWHDTQAEVNACVREKKKVMSRWEKKARKDTKNEKDDEIQSLRGELDELKEMMKKLLEAK